MIGLVDWGESVGESIPERKGKVVVEDFIIRKPPASRKCERAGLWGDGGNLRDGDHPIAGWKERL